MASLLRRFFSRGSLPGAALSLSWYAEAQFAGWMPAPDQLETRAAAARTAPESVDVEGLLGRFYASQEC
jgi:hypothetical protein